MLRYALRRCAVGVGLAWVVLTLIFLSLHAVPGDPAEVILSGEGAGAVTQEAVAQVRAELGLDRPLGVQYLQYLGGVLTGDLGTSFTDRAPVTEHLADRLPATASIVLVAAVIGISAGIVIGSWAGRGGRVADAVVGIGTGLGVSVPVYVLGSLLVLVFALTLRALPAGGYRAFADDPAGHLERLILPSLAVAVAFACVVARMTRSAVVETARQDWVRTGRAVGMTRAGVFRVHVLRNALAPVVTVSGLEIGTLLGSTVLVERIFNWPGTGSLLVDAVAQRDYPVVQGIVLAVAVAFIALNIVVDLVYGVLDPRVVHR
ncbi:ABC transporter permease [Pseudonocardia nematodicida]|uniref:ABC transporter permease n=1 Tax=Pseudonocardia nematodicida TaxID=1206997 RepID=A0ABV1K6B4_9PSEU